VKTMPNLLHSQIYFLAIGLQKYTGYIISDVI